MNHEPTLYLQSIIDNLPNYFIFWKDQHSHFLGCNQLFAKSAGFQSPSEIIGKSDYDMPWSARAAEYVRVDQEIIKTGKAQIAFEEEEPQKDGRISTMLVTKVPIFDAEHQAIGVLCIYSDVTERKRMEKNLIEAKEKAEAANSAKTEFLENMRHDIRPPPRRNYWILSAHSSGKQRSQNIKIR